MYLAGSSAASAVSLRHGGGGMVPSAGNLVPELYQQLYLAAKSGDFTTAEHFQKITDDVTALYAHGQPLNKALPRLKALMEIVGLCQATPMPPFAIIDDQTKMALEERMHANPHLSPFP